MEKDSVSLSYLPSSSDLSSSEREEKDDKAGNEPGKYSPGEEKDYESPDKDSDRSRFLEKVRKGSMRGFPQDGKWSIITLVLYWILGLTGLGLFLYVLIRKYF